MDLWTQAVSRRDFIRGVGVLGVAAPLIGGSFGGLFWGEPTRVEGASPEPLPRRRPGSLQHRVVVIGAGLAGLAAAWELDEAGHEAVVLEAKSHPGGRVRTLRDPFAEDLYAEAGAVAFYETYTQANRYIDELGLERAEVPEPYLALYHLNGERFSAGGDQQLDWPYELSEEEEGLGPMGLMQRYLFETLPEEIAEPEAWDEPPLSQLDEVSLAEYLRGQDASPGAVDLIADIYTNFGRIDQTSTLSAALADFGLIFGGGPPFVLAGGNDQLPCAMANRLSRQIRYGVEVTGLRDTDQGVEVRAERMGQTETYEADRAICTVPLGVLPEIGVEPRMPAEKRGAISEVPYVDATRTFLQVGRAFWHDEGVTGAAYTDLPIGTVYRHPAEGTAGLNERAILEGYAKGAVASRQASRPDDEIVEQVLSEMEKVHPGIGEHVEGAVVKAWGEDPHARGHVSWPGPGDVTTHLEALQEPHGRIHFAGEHTSVLRGTMEGALRSGVRAAWEVDEAAGD